MAQKRGKRRREKPQVVSGGKGEIVIFRGTKGTPALEVRLEENTLWLTQKQMAMLFDTERSVITKHLRNVFRDAELERESVCAKFAHTAEDGKVYQTDSYNLDAILSVGYRVNSVRGTQFRIADNALVAMTLLIAESRPAEKDILTRVLVNLINRRNA